MADRELPRERVSRHLRVREPALRGAGSRTPGRHNRPVTDLGTVRRRPAGVLVVGRAEPELQPWLRGEGHAVRAVSGVDAALAGLDEAPADLVIVDREPTGLDTPSVCRALRDDPRLDEAWLLAISEAAKGTRADAALRAGADDYVHRPFTRGELLARARNGLRAVQQRADDGLVRALMVNVPGAIYRSAWHAGQRIELISDEIERISGYPPINFIASARRTLLSIIHPDDLDEVVRAVATAADQREPFVFEYRIVRADGEVRWVLDRGQLVHGAGGRLWMDGAILDVTERRAAEEALRRHEIEQARAEELRASRVRIVQAADAARRKIERDLHDGAQQRLVSLAIEVRLARSRVDKEPDAAGPFLERLGEELAGASAELRELARGIHPAVLTERGLAPAIAALATRAPVPVEILDLPEDRLPATVEATAYFTVAEALTNVAKYAQATHATVRAAREDDAVVVEIRDDGVGGARADAGSGLSGLADRIGACDGTLTVESPPGEGTLVRAVLPVADA
jgi:PAS domain S-box-containing protein